MNCKRLNKIYLYHNKLTKIDLTPLKYLNDLKGLFLNGNPLTELNLSHIPSTINRIEVNKKYKLLNAHQFSDKITYNNEIKPQIIYTNDFERDQNSEEDYGYDEDIGYQEIYERFPNDQRSDVMNPNNPEHQANLDNRANQLNPQHPAYRSSRGKK